MGTSSSERLSVLSFEDRARLSVFRDVVSLGAVGCSRGIVDFRVLPFSSLISKNSLFLKKSPVQAKQSEYW